MAEILKKKNCPQGALIPQTCPDDRALMTEDSQKKAVPCSPDLADQARSPTSTTDAILGRFLQMTARWKAFIELETVRPSLDRWWWSVDSVPIIRAPVSERCFVANQVPPGFWRVAFIKTFDGGGQLAIAS